MKLAPVLLVACCSLLSCFFGTLFAMTKKIFYFFFRLSFGNILADYAYMALLCYL